MIFEPRSVQQVAALPFVVIETQIEVLLITSRRRGRWIVPKGWPVGNRTHWEAARAEAKQEAGIRGAVHPDPIGEFKYIKQATEGYDIRCHVFVYPLLVHLHQIDWRERTERQLRWSGLDEAAGLVDDRDLGKLLRGLANANGEPLRTISDRLAA